MKIIEGIRNFFPNWKSVPASEWIHFFSLLKPQRIRRHDFFFRQGNPIQEIGFVVNGLMYNYYTDKDGREHAKWFAPEGAPVTCYTGLLQQKPASCSARAIESTLLLTLQYDLLLSLYERHRCWEQSGRIIAEKLFIEKENRELNFLTEDARSRYQNFLEQHKSLVPRIPQYLVASYIGITPVALSRIRSTSV